MILFLAAYALVALVHAATNRSDFKRNPEKAARYRLLPLPYKLCCWFGVQPLLASAVLESAASILGLVSWFLLEAACVSWYRKHQL